MATESHSAGLAYASSGTTLGGAIQTGNITGYVPNVFAPAVGQQVPAGATALATAAAADLATLTGFTVSGGTIKQATASAAGV